MSKSITAEQQQELQKLQQMTQQLNVFHQNYLQMESRRRELEKTLEVLEKVDDNSDVYRAAGQILFKANAGETNADLKDQLEILIVRITKTKTQLDAFEKQVKDKEAELRSTIQ